MNDLIRRQDIIDALDGAYEHWSISELYYQGIRTGLRQAARLVLSLPSAQKNGHWVQNDNRTWYCSRCKSWIPDEQHYYARFCLFCGAEMQKGDQNE